MNKSKKINRPEELIENIMNMMGMILENILFMRESLLQMIFNSIPPQLIEDLAQIIMDNYKEKPNLV